MQEVQVEVGRETREGYRTEQIRFTGEKRDWYVDDRTEAGYTLYGVPDERFRVPWRAPCASA